MAGLSAYIGFLGVIRTNASRRLWRPPGTAPRQERPAPGRARPGRCAVVRFGQRFTYVATKFGGW